MVLRISSAEIVSSAMALASSSAGSLVRWVGRVAALAVLSAGQPPAGGLESVGDAAVDDLVVDADDQTAEHRRVDLDLQAHGPPVEALEGGDQATLLRGGERYGADHVGDRLTAPAGPRGGPPVDLGFRTVHVRAAQVVPDQLLGDRADLPDQQPV